VVTAKTASSLVQAPAKRNMPTTLSTPLQPAREKPLFDRHGEAGDQPRNLIQMSRIKRLNGFRKTKQAFVSLMAGMSPGTIEGPAWIGAVATAGIESAP